MLVADHHTPEELRDLAQAIPERRIWRRLRAVILAQQGWTAPTIAQSLGCSLRSVKSWVAQYNRGGPEALHERPRAGRPRRLDPEHSPRLKRRLDAPPTRRDGVCTLRGHDIRRVLEQELGVALSPQAAYDLLGRIGYSSRMPRPRHEGSIPEVQESFKEIVVDQIQAIAEEHPEKEVRVYFGDEARFGTQGTITRAWARRGSRPRAVRQNGRQWLYVLMAVCVATGTTSALIMPGLDVGVINLFLEQSSKELPGGAHAVPIWDGAGYHTGGDLVVPGNVSLVLLPPYSPELDPAEDQWHYLRSHHWSNRPYEGYDGLEREAVRSLCAVCEDAERLKSIGNAEYVKARA